MHPTRCGTNTLLQRVQCRLFRVRILRMAEPPGPGLLHSRRCKQAKLEASAQSQLTLQREFARTPCTTATFTPRRRVPAMQPSACQNNVGCRMRVAHPVPRLRGGSRGTLDIRRPIKLDRCTTSTCAVKNTVAHSTPPSLPCLQQHSGSKLYVCTSFARGTQPASSLAPLPG